MRTPKKKGIILLHSGAHAHLQLIEDILRKVLAPEQDPFKKVLLKAAETIYRGTPLLCKRTSRANPTLHQGHFSASDCAE